MIKFIAIWVCLASISQAQNSFSFGMAPQQQQYQRMPMQGMPMQGGYPMPMNRGMPMGAPMGGGGGGGGGIPIGPIIGIVGSLIQMAIAEDAKEKAIKQQNPYDINTSAGDSSSYQPYPARQTPAPAPVYRPIKTVPMADTQKKPLPVKRISNNKAHAYSEYFDDNNDEEQQTQDAEQTNYLDSNYNQSQETEDNTAEYSQRQETERSVYHKVGEQYTGQGVRTYYASGPFDKEVNGVPNGVVLPNGNIRSPFSDYTIDVMQSNETSEGKIITDPNTKREFRIPGFSN